MKRLRAQIELHLGNMMDKEIDRHSFSPQTNLQGNEGLVKQITNKIFESPQYVIRVQIFYVIL